MRCPFCKSAATSVIDSRIADDGESVRRRRKCDDCDKRFTTYERTELQMPVVVKSSGYRTPFDHAKLHTGFVRALHKRPVPTEYIDAAVTRVEQKLLASGEREVSSRAIGEMVMRELKKMDDVAYIRFASVYEDFQRVDDFRDKVLEVKRPGAQRPGIAGATLQGSTLQSPGIPTPGVKRLRSPLSVLPKITSKPN